jgi:hypothetical protein
MMPLAFDLISTLLIGSILPVATTDRTIVPRSTVASLEGSMAVDAPLSVEKPQMPAIARTTTAAAIRLNLRDFFMLEPRAGHTGLLTSGTHEKLPRATRLCGFCAP